MASAGSSRGAFDQALVDLLVEGVFELDGAGRVLRMNRAAERILGLDQASLQALVDAPDDRCLRIGRSVAAPEAPQ